MAARTTERLHDRAGGLDLLPGADAAAALLDGQLAAVAAVRPALSDLSRAADLAAKSLMAGGRLVYAGAGSSALMAVADGAELNGTFGIPADRILLCMAGGIPQDARMPGDVEDMTDEAAAIGAGLSPDDTVIAVTASGSTPYPLALARAARAKGARIVGIANNAGAPLFAVSDVAVCLPTPPEVLAGSTRMGAGSAQKVALNIFSTLLGIRLGQVHDGMMVGVIADNDKLRERAAGIVAAIAGVAPAMAVASLRQTGGAVKAAVLVAKGALPGEAAQLLEEERGFLRPALARLAAINAPPEKTGPDGRK